MGVLVRTAEPLAVVATDGARRLQEHIKASKRPAAANGEADRLVGAGVSR